MNRKKYLTESMVSDLGEQIVNNVYQTLMDYGYEQHEIDNIVTRDSIELDINNNECVLYCGNDIIFKTPGNILIHKFVTEAEDHLLQWCINKIGRKPNYLDANELFGDVPGWNNLNEAYGTDFEDTLAWVQNKFPNKSEKEQHQFAKNIMKRYVAPAETNSTDVVEKPKTRKNVKLIKIVDIPNHGRHQDVYCKSLLLRTARKPGDTERVNHTVLGRLNAAGVKYEIIDENVNKNMAKKNTIRLTESELKQVISESVKKILKESAYDSNDRFTSSITSNMTANNMQQQTSNFRHVKDLDQASRKAIIDRIKRVCTTKDGYFDADEYRLEKEFNMSSDEMEEKGIWDIVRNMIEIALEGGYLY